MKTQSLFIYATVTMLLFGSILSFAQSPDLGIAGNFILFTSVGAVGNTGISQLTGNIGTNTGAITGFGNVNGIMHNTDATTAQAVIDLQSAWYQLDTTSITATHIPVLGNGETLYPGVYSIAAAGSLVSVLTLDAQGDSAAIFIIKTGGAFTTAASSTVNLVNGASACNVFWKAEGAIGLAASTIMHGNLIAHNAAIAVGAGCIIDGRALSTTGSVTVYGTLTAIPPACGSPVLSGAVSPQLGTLECFALFTSNGAVSNAGVTNITGDIGSDYGPTTGYDPLLVSGWIHTVPDVVTAQCATDFITIYTYLNTLPYDIELLYPAQFGNGLVLTPNTYRMNAATALTDTLYLDAQGNTNAVFVFQVGGALSTSTYSNVKLLNGALATNIYWKVEGAVTINSNSVFCGNIICNNAAIFLDTDVLLNGRAITGTGAVTTNDLSTTMPSGANCSALLALPDLHFTGSCDDNHTVLSWHTTVTNNRYFTVERSADAIHWLTLGRVESFPATNLYSFTDKLSFSATLYYRLKQTNLNGHDTYGNVITINECAASPTTRLVLYPNPSPGIFNLQFSGDKHLVTDVKIFNANGDKVYESTGFQSQFNLSEKPRGLYFVQLNLGTKIISTKVLIEQ